MKVILVLNSGSSSLKFGLFGHDAPDRNPALVSGQIEAIGRAPRLRARTRDGNVVDDALATPNEGVEVHEHALEHLLQWLAQHHGEYTIVAAGHRVVHGGAAHSGPALLDDDVMHALEQLVPLAPLHQPHNLRGVRAVSARLPDVPQVACFDTAFHRTQPPVAQAFALPREMSDAGIRRYGFHGLSYDYVARQLPEVVGSGADGAVVIAHLGAGASMCALHARRSVASTMGFTAIDGLMMATRSGSIDPGVLLYLMENRGMDAAALTDLLYHRSGLLGVSGISADMRTLLDSDAAEAREAITLFCYRIAREIGSLMAAAGGLDALVFTGGIGEHAAAIREKVAELAAWTGMRIDPARNAAHASRIDADDSTVAVAVIPTDEETMIAAYTRSLLGLHAQ